MNHRNLIWILLSFCIFKIQSKVFEPAIKYPLPFYNEIAPCPCDLTENHCDFQCCCDQDCPEDFHGNWTCIEGLEGGQNQGQFLTNNCSNQPHLFDSDWNSLLCLTSKSRSSYLGLYYEEQTQVNPNLKPSSTSPKSTYAKKQANLPLQLRIYKHGNPIRVVYNASNGIYGNLNMPMTLGTSSKCVWSPISYLENSISKCPRRLSPDLCSKNSALDYQMFLMPLPKGIDVGNIPKVLRVPYQPDLVDLEVNYYASLDPDFYVSNHHDFHFHQVQVDSVSSIDAILSQFDSVESAEDDLPFDKCVKMTRLSSQNDFYQEDQVHLLDNKCINAVLEVNYKFLWASNEIIKITANVLLGNLTLHPMLQEEGDDMVISENNFQEMHQIFSVNFVHDYQETKETEEISRNPGYNIGFPVRGISNETQEEIPLRIWHASKASKADKSSNCNSVSLRQITFLEDTQSGCLLQLWRQNFTDCDQLRNDIRSLQAELIELKLMISKGKDLDDFVPIIFEDFSTISSAAAENDTLFLQCDNVPSHLHVEVMYTNSLGIYRINGFKVNYFPEKWRWNCHKCSSETKELKSTVQFIQVPVVWHYQNTSKFWILQNLHNCDGDQCWQQLFYAFTHYQDGDSVAYAVQWALILVPSSLLLMWFTRDLW